MIQDLKSIVNLAVFIMKQWSRKMKFIGGGKTLDTGHGLGHVICICTHDAMHVYM